MKNLIKTSALELVEDQIRRGFRPRWFVTYHYNHPSDSLVPEQEENSNRIGYRDSDRGCPDSELNHNQWNRSEAYTAKEKIKNSREHVEENTVDIKNKLLKRLFKVKKLHLYQKKKYNVQPMLFFHEKGKQKIKYHTHLVLPDTKLNLNNERYIEDIFESNVPNGMKDQCKCLSKEKSIKVIDIYDHQGLFKYLNKETTPEEMSLDITGSLMYTRRKDTLLNDSIGYEVTSVGTGKQGRRLTSKKKKNKTGVKIENCLDDEELEERQRVERMLNDVLEHQTKSKQEYISTYEEEFNCWWWKAECNSRQLEIA